MAELLVCSNADLNAKGLVRPLPTAVTALQSLFF